MISADHDPRSTKSPVAATCQAATHVKLLGSLPAMHVELWCSLVLTASYACCVTGHAIPHAHPGDVLSQWTHAIHVSVVEVTVMMMEWYRL